MEGLILCTAQPRNSDLVGRGLRDRAADRREDLLSEPQIATMRLVSSARLQSAWAAWEGDPGRYRSRPLFVSLLVEAWLRILPANAAEAR